MNVLSTITGQRRDYILHWVKMVWITGLAQMAVQVLGFASGLLVIHLLSVQEYAYYTLANGMLATMTLLADGGISTGVIAQGGRIWQDRIRLGVVVTSGLELRRKFAIFGLGTGVPIMLFLLHHHGASWMMGTIVSLCLIPAFVSVLSGSLLEIVPRLRQEIAPLQKIQVQANGVRLALIGLTLFTLPKAFVALCAAGFPQFWVNRRLRDLSGQHADLSQKSDVIIKNEIMLIVKRIMPGTIYYCFSGQITIFIIALFGSSRSLAQVGALSRLAAALNLIGALFNTLVLPRFVRQMVHRKTMLARFFKLQVGFGMLFGVITLMASVFSRQMIWVLGKDYVGINGEVVYIMAGSCLSMISGMTYHLCVSLGHVLRPAISVGISILTQLIALYYIDCTTVHGVFIFSIYTAIMQYIMWFYYFIHIYNNEKL